MRIEAHGIAVDLPHGWDGRIYRRPAGDPTLHAATFPLPSHDGDFGSRAIEAMPRGASFVVLTEYRPGRGLEPGRGLFAADELPLPLDHSRFHPHALHVTLPGRAGLQHFFTRAGRPFCLYAVVRGHGGRRVRAAAAQVGAIETVLRSVEIQRVRRPV